MTTKLLDSVSGGGAVAGIVTILTQTQVILGCIASLVAIATGILSIIIKIKNSKKDGEVSPEEVKDISNEIKKLRDKILGGNDNDGI